jgi:hypothetical protein
LYRTGQGIENTWIKHEQTISNHAAAVVANDTATNKSLADQVAQAKTEAQKQNDQLNADITAKLTALQQQQQLDQKLSQQQILDRWKLLLPMKPGAVQQIGNTDQITPDAALSTVTALEQIPVLKLQLTDLSMELLSDTQTIVKQDNLIAGLNQQIVDEKKSHVDDVNLEKSKARRSWVRGFKWGIVVGAVGTEAIRVWAGRP